MLWQNNRCESDGFPYTTLLCTGQFNIYHTILVLTPTAIPFLYTTKPQVLTHHACEFAAG